jgi:uncharacterized membrane protein YcfT
MNPNTKLTGFTLAVLFLLFGLKRFAIETWGRDAYREALVYFSGVALFVILAFGVTSMVRDRRKKND